MKSKDIRIVFMGNPEFAVPSLEQMNKHFNIVGVVTGPDRKGGRGRKEIIESAVKKKAIELGIPFLQPEKLRDAEFIIALKAWNADLQVVVAFRMLPRIVWSMPPMGTINLHSSLLPAYRGAAPINWAIINGEAITGLTTFRLAHEIDTGDIIMSRKLDIGPDETAGHLHDRMMVAGAGLLVETVERILDGSAKPLPQDESKVSAAPKIFHDDAKIDPLKSVRQIHNFVRGMSPYPGAWYPFSDGKTIKIIKGVPLNYKTSFDPGVWVSDGKKFLALVVKDGFYKCIEVKLSGKRAMLVSELLNGMDLSGSEVQCDDIFSKAK